MNSREIQVVFRLAKCSLLANEGGSFKIFHIFGIWTELKLRDRETENFFLIKIENPRTEEMTI